MKTRFFRGLPALLLAALAAASVAEAQTVPARVPVLFSGGHDTDPRDRGRPVVLIAAALGVTADVFREAFSRVRPAPAGSEPEPGQVRLNKAALMAALGPYGVTNERLDAVSNYYRYNRSRGEMWPVRPAAACAVVENGAVTSIVVTDGGAGYSSPPAAAVPGFKDAVGTVQLAFEAAFETNGSVSAVPVAKAGAR